MERETGDRRLGKERPRGRTRRLRVAGGGWLVNIVPVWKDIDMENSCPKAAAGRNHVCAALTL